MPDNFIPLFKEKTMGETVDQFYFHEGSWVRCNESKISYLWRQWVSSDNADNVRDEEGFLVFGNYKE